MIRLACALISSISIAALTPGDGCDPPAPTTDQIVQAKQDQSLAQAANAVGMPAIVNFQEMRMAKDIYELRDKTISTHTYLVNEMKGCLIYLGPSVGFGLPYATQYSSPTKWTQLSRNGGGWSWEQVPQAEPNGLFMPAAAEGTWVMLKDPVSGEAKPSYIEPRAIVLQFRLPDQECVNASVTAIKK
jgi:hypothetical protein